MMDDTNIEVDTDLDRLNPIKKCELWESKV